MFLQRLDHNLLGFIRPDSSDGGVEDLLLDRRVLLERLADAIEQLASPASSVLSTSLNRRLTSRCCRFRRSVAFIVLREPRVAVRTVAM